MTSGSKQGAAEPRLAYRDLEFLESSDARGLRILAEYYDPLVRLQRAGVKRTVVFFGSARVSSREEARKKLRELTVRQRKDSRPTRAELERARMDLQMARFYEDARELSRIITLWAMEMGKGPDVLTVCSGGGPGIMEAANRGASEAGGKSIGLNIKLPREQSPNPYISPELSMLFRYFFMRKLWFAQPAQALIVFPGGFGTMDEMFEFLTLIQTRKMGHQVKILLYGSRFWKSVVRFDRLLQAGTISQDEFKLVRFVDTPQKALEIIKRDLELRPKPAPIGKRHFM